MARFTLKLDVGLSLPKPRLLPKCRPQVIGVKPFEKLQPRSVSRIVVL